MAGYLIAGVAFALPLAFGAGGLGRPRLVLGVGGILALTTTVVLLAGRAEDAGGRKVVPVWFLVGLAVLLYLIWCGGLWLGLRLRRVHAD